MLTTLFNCTKTICDTECPLHHSNNQHHVRSTGYEEKLIHGESTAHGGMFLHIRLMYVLNLCWNYSKILAMWYQFKIIPILTKEETCNNYHTITLLHTKYKVYGRIINTIQNTADVILLENQKRFRPGHSYATMFFTIEERVKRRSEFNKVNNFILLTYIHFSGSR